MTKSEDRMTNQTTICLAGLAAMLAAAASGCGLFVKSPPPKPQLYAVEGRVIDAQTGNGMLNVRVMVRATIPAMANATGLPPMSGKAPALGGQILMTGYGMTGTEGRYRVELSEGFEIARLATQIRVEVSAPGYLAEGADMPIPKADQAAYKAPDILLSRAYRLPPAPLPGPTPTAPEKAIPWK
jgi:hypothetical protein